MDSFLLVVIGLFVVTNLDALIVIGAFCADNDYRIWEVFIGHYVSFCIGLSLAVLGALVATELFEEWMYLIGILPLSVGIWGLLDRPPEDVVEDAPAIPNVIGRIGVVMIAGLGISGENIAVYIPLLTGLSTAELLLIIGIYLVGAGLVFLFAYLIVHRVVTDGISERLDRWLVPTVLVIVGGYVLAMGLLLT